MEQDNTQDQSELDKAGGDQPTLEQLKAELLEARNEATKLRNIKAELAKERDNLKKKVKTDTSAEEDYKALWQEANDKATKLVERARNQAVDAAVMSKLTKAGVMADALDAAVKLVDRNLIQWDEDTGVEEATVVAAVQKLKGSFGFMFEKKVGLTKAKEASEGSTADKTMTRTEFMKLDAVTRAKRMREGWTLTN